MPLPPDLLAAISNLAKGKVSLVTGAGCSLEPPTSIPLASTCAKSCHDDLVADGHIDIGACANPHDLSCVADSVFDKCGSQQPLVELLLSKFELKAPSPNKGHYIAAALLAEGAIASVITLNFDLAFTIAIGYLGVSHEVGIVDGPHEFARQKTQTLYYLHRNANSGDYDSWVLRTSAIATEWKESWEQLITSKVLTTPVVVFAGLGSSAAVLFESVKLLRGAVPAAVHTYQVDPTDFSKSNFAQALAIQERDFIKLGWCDFMEELSQRVVASQVDNINNAANAYCTRNAIQIENLTALVSQMKQEFNLLELGALRSHWLLANNRYRCDDTRDCELMADLLLAVAFISRTRSTDARIRTDGIIDFVRGDLIVASCILASGKGTDRCAAIEAEVSRRLKGLRNHSASPTGVIVSATSDGISPTITPPDDIVTGENGDDILFGQDRIQYWHVESIRTGVSGTEIVP